MNFESSSQQINSFVLIIKVLMEHCAMCIVFISVNNKTTILRSCFWEDMDTPQASCNRNSNSNPSFVKIEFCETCFTDGCNTWISKIWKTICNQSYVCILFPLRITLSKFNFNKLKTWINIIWDYLLHQFCNKVCCGNMFLFFLLRT